MQGNGKFWPNRINPKEPDKLQPLPWSVSNKKTTKFTSAHLIKGSIRDVLKREKHKGET